MPGLFIDVQVDDSVRGDAELAKKLEEVCPVDIYKATAPASRSSSGSSTSACLAARLTAPAGAVRVIKLYDDGAALERR